MYKLPILLIAIAMSGCSKVDIDSGSKNVSKASGKSIQLECMKSNLKNIGNLSTETETASSLILVGTGIKSTIEFESENSVITSYSIVTETEKHKDGEIHKAVEAVINAPCNT